MEKQYNKIIDRISYFQKRCKRFVYPIPTSEFVEEWFVIRFVCENEEYTWKHVKENKTCSYAIDRLVVDYNEQYTIIQKTHLETLPFDTVETLIEYLLRMNINPEFYRASV